MTKVLFIGNEPSKAPRHDLHGLKAHGYLLTPLSEEDYLPKLELLTELIRAQRWLDLKNSPRGDLL